MSKNEWDGLKKSATKRIGPIKYNGFVLEAELDVEPGENQKWFTTIKNYSGQEVPVNFSPYDDPEAMFKMWVDAGSPSVPEVRTGGIVGGNIYREDLERFIQAKKGMSDPERQQEIERIFGEAKANATIKFAQFQDETTQPAKETAKTSPPYRLPDLAKSLESVVKVAKTSITGEGIELVAEFKDGKMYTIRLAPFKG